MNTIVSVDSNWGIGKDNDLLFHVPEDLRYFKSKTINKVVVMGEKTFYSLPNQKPLKDRVNIVLSDNPHLRIAGVQICNSLDELLSLLSTYDSNDVFIIGGQAVYALMLEYCDKAYVTKFRATAQADKHFPNLDEHDDWVLTAQSEPHESNGLTFTFDVYEKSKPD